MSNLPSISSRAFDSGGVAEYGLRLRADEVDVWRGALDDQSASTVESLRMLLSKDERERANRFFFDRDRRRFIVARGILRTLLGKYLSRHPAQLAFTYGPNGKPRLVQPAGEAPLYFNVAHSDDLALFAVTSVGEVGVDLEKVRDLPDWRSVAEASFSAPELARLRACPPDRQRDEFFAAWTRQEAVLKALGTGLGGATAGTETAFVVHPLNPAPGYAGALAAAPGADCAGAIRGWESLPVTNEFPEPTSSQSAPLSKLDRI
jgi:4'-phosphopantetheinyl transferase